MLEFLSSGILGSALGGLFRLAPEILKFYDRKNERNHELGMFRLQTELEKQKGQFKMEERYVDYGITQLSAIKEAFKDQSDSASNSYKWVAAASALVRPSITYALFGMYVAVKFILMATALQSSAVTWTEVIATSWTAEDIGMLNMILTFWFVGRSIEKYQK